METLAYVVSVLAVGSGVTVGVSGIWVILRILESWARDSGVGVSVNRRNLAIGYGIGLSAIGFGVILIVGGLDVWP